MRKLVCVAAASALLGACTALGQLRGFVQPPRFEEAPGQPAEIRLLDAAPDRPLGGAGLRLWVQVSNPNAFGFTLSTLRGTLYLEEERAATTDFPLGLPLDAGGTATIAIDFTMGFDDVPALVQALRHAVGRESLAYRLDGTVGVDAGRFGTPVFGPMTLLRGEVAAGRP
jgi:hypothetical protein